MSDSKISFKIESLPKPEGLSNYTRWAGAINLALKAYKLWSSTKPRPTTETEKGKEPGESESSTVEDQVKWHEQGDQAEAVIMFSLLANDLTTVTDAASAQAAWQAQRPLRPRNGQYHHQPPEERHRAQALMVLLFKIILPDSIMIGFSS